MSSKWKFRGKSIKTIEDIPECCPFMVYIIKFPTTGEYYIGSKQIYSVTNAKISKKRSMELWSGKGRKPVREKKIKESDWKTYKSSSKTVQERLMKGEPATFTVVDFLPNKRDMLLLEAKMIIESFLPLDEKVLNSWVSIKMFKG